MYEADVEKIFKKGLEALNRGDTLSALSHFEKIINIERIPSVCSAYAYCIAKERGQISNAISLCEEAIQKEPQNAFHYLNLGRIYLIDNNRAEAIKTLREGLKYEENQVIIEILNKLGLRRPPIIKFLKRSHPLNKYLGIILRTKRGRKTVYASIIFLLILTMSFILFQYYSERTEVPIPDLKTELQTKPLETKPEAIPTPTEIKPEVPTTKTENIPDKTTHTPEIKSQDSKILESNKYIHTLELIADDKTWILVNIDDTQTKEILLNQGEHIKLNAKKTFYLKIGNAGGVKLIFNGKEIEPLGEKGKVVTITLPQTTVSSTETPKKSFDSE